MKRKCLLIVLAMLCALCCALGLAGCNEERETNVRTSADSAAGTYYLYGYTVETASDSAQATLCAAYDYHEFIRLYDNGTFDYYWLAQYSPFYFIEEKGWSTGSLEQGIYGGVYQLSDDGSIVLTFHYIPATSIADEFPTMTGTLSDGVMQLEGELYESAYFCKEGCAYRRTAD